MLTRIKLGRSAVHTNIQHDKSKLEDLTVLQHSPDLLNNVKIGQDHLQHIMKHIPFYGGCGHYGQVA